ncbi:MAG: hypothetical protein KAU01_12105, partial [Candidatus Cloacimonetes bacterium]|nr:hypothetical protein [Candidatus Cloacimonadota bacterium]
MKFVYLIIIITLFVFPLFSQNVQLNGDKNFLQITGSFEIEKISSKYIINEEYNQLEISDCVNSGRPEEAELPVYTKFVSLPETGNFKVINSQYEFEETDIDKKIIPFGWQDNQNFTENYYQRDQWLPEDIVTISKPNIMRGVRFSQITIAAVQYNPALNKIRILKNINFEFTVDHSITDNPLTKSTSHKAFTKLAQIKIYGTTPVRDSEEGQYLFISPDNISTTLEPLLRWKEKLGYKTKLATLSETGSTNDAIKDYLQDAYDNWETPPEYVVLVGDVSGSIVVPSFYVQGYYTPWDVTDHSYTLLDGDDYFPDIMIGRISIQSQIQLNTVINKIISYESNPYMETDWMKRALMISYIDDGWWQFYSPRETVMACREKLLDFEFTEVDTFISPWQTSSSQLINKINSGYSFVNYRGAGGPSYWYEPYFNSDHVNNLSNGYMLPMVTSITCGGGNFAYSGNPSCFGETWLIAGSPSVPKGAIAFIGPSEIDTKTWFNNAIDMGIYHGVTQENLFKCAEMMLAGKMDAYINYPYCHAWGNALNSDQFYFYVYNLLGDPGLAIWTDIPQEVDIVFESEFIAGLNCLEVEIVEPFIDKSGFTIAITNSDSLVVCGLTDETGSVVIPVDLQPGDYCVTSSKYGFIPKTEDLTVIEANIVALLDYCLEETISGQTIDFEATFKNLGNQTAEDIEIELVSNDNYIQILSGSASTSTLAPEEVFTGNFQLEINPEWKNGFQFELYFNVSSNLGLNDFLVLIEIQSPEVCLSDFIVNNLQGKLIQNTACEVNIELLNCGDINSDEVYVNLTSLNYNTNVISGTSTFPSIPVNNTAINLAPFE